MENEVLKYSGKKISEVMGIDFSDDQLAGITADLEPGVIIASAGSGKTTVMAARVVFLVANEKVKAEQILGLTFTNLATGELRSRVRLSLEKLGVHNKDTEISAEPFVTTYHAFASQMIKQFGMYIKVEPDHQVITDVRRQQLCARTISNSTADFSKVNVSFPYILERTLDLDSNLSENNVSISKFKEFAEKLKADAPVLSEEENNPWLKLAEGQLFYADLVAEFRAAKMAYNAVDYSDMNRFALDILKAKPEIAKQMRDEYKLVLLDEYQDTSISQRALIQQLFGDAHPINAVGDPLQSIYAFRGANPRNISNFPNHFKNGNGDKGSQFDLPVTQRNGKNIVQLANVLTNRLRMPDAHPELKPLVATDKPKYGPGKIHISSFRNMEEEADWVIKEIKAFEAAGVPLEEIALLFRKGKGIAWALKVLNEAGIPAQVRTKMDLLEVPEIVELISMLRVIAEPAANSAWIRLLTGPRWRIGNRDLAIIGKRASKLAYNARVSGERNLEIALDAAIAGSDVVEATAYGDAISDIVEKGSAELSTEALSRITNLNNEINFLRTQAGDPLKHFVYRVASVSGLLIESIADTSRIKRGMDSNLRSFFKLVSDFSSLDGDSTLFAFLRWIDDSKKHESAISITPVVHEGAVQLITVHSAKGLQFRIVGLPHLTDGIFPASSGSDNWVTNSHVVPYALKEEPNVILNRYPTRGKLEDAAEAKAYKEAKDEADALEERRLAYVALTRAEEAVFVSSSAVDPSVQNLRGPSIYFTEILESLRAMESEIEAGNIRIDSIYEFIKGKADDSETVESGEWPIELKSEVISRVRESAARVKKLMSTDFEIAPAQSNLVEQWDLAIKAIEKEIESHNNPERIVPLPESLSVTQIQNLAKDEAAFVENLIRPMPTEPAFAAAQGTAFHSFVEGWAREMQGGSVTSTFPYMEYLDKSEEELIDLPTLAKFQVTFRKSVWAEKAPHIVEAPFAISLGGYIVRGRIDAVYKDGDNYTLVDWKTNAKANADTLQLAIYRHAWADSMNVPLENISASFYYVALDETVTPETFPSREEIIKLLSGS